VRPVLVIVSLAIRRRPSDSRAFVLAAVWYFKKKKFYVVLSPVARFHSRVSERRPPGADTPAHYESENRPLAAASATSRVYIPIAWGVCPYVLCLMGVASSYRAASCGSMHSIPEISTRERGSGQLWRAWTALTLHLDGSPAANLGVGCLVSVIFAAAISEVGKPWFLIVTALPSPILSKDLGAPTNRKNREKSKQ